MSHGASRNVVGLVAFSSTSGNLEAGFPQVAGSIDGQTPQVSALVADGRGGWYVGGLFRSIGGVICPNLAHVLSDRRVDRDWCPRPHGSDDGGIYAVRALVRLGSRLYVAGENLTRIGGQPRANLAAFDTVSGRLLPWRADVRGHDYAAVYQLALNASGSLLYVSGNFDHISGAKRSDFAAVSTTTGHAGTFAPNPDENFHGDSVDAFAVTPERVYAWGYYSEIGGHSVDHLGESDALDVNTGRWLADQPRLNGGPNATVVVGDTVYVGGVFAQLGGAIREDIGAFVGSSAAVTAWAPTTGHELVVEQLTRSKDRIVAVLTADHWDASPRRLVTYDRRDGHLIWQSAAQLRSASAIAADANTILVAS